MMTESAIASGAADQALQAVRASIKLAQEAGNSEVLKQSRVCMARLHTHIKSNYCTHIELAGSVARARRNERACQDERRCWGQHARDPIDADI